MSETATTTDTVREYLRAFNERDWDAFRELLADDVVEHSAGEDLHGADEIIEFFEGRFETFPDYEGSTEAMIAEGDLVTVRYTARGTHSGEFEGVEPTGQSIEWTGIAIYRVEGDEIAEIWLEYDRLGLLDQLEVLERPAHLRM